MNQHMPFSWKAMLLAPLPVPFVASVFIAMKPSKNRLLAFLFFFVVGSLFSYGVTACLLLPCLFVFSRFLRLTAWLAGVLGMGLGIATYAPIAWVSYLSTGVDSDPPTGTFKEYLCRNGWGEGWPFLVGGLLTALAYWFLAKPTDRNNP